MLGWVLIVAVAAFVFWFVLVPLFERFAPRRAVQAYQRAANPLFRTSAGFVPGFGVIETIGRKSGLPRQTPVGGKVKGDSFWFVAGIGAQALYMRNIAANPRVRVKTLGRWHTGTAHGCPDDNAKRRRFAVSPVNGIFLFFAGVTPPPTPIADSTPQVWEWAITVNLFGVVNGVRAFLPDMLERGTGRIANTASLLGITSGDRLAPYAASKAGVIAMSIALRDELAGSGVGVSVVLPHVASSIGTSTRNWPARLGSDPWLGARRDERSLEIEELTNGYVGAGLAPEQAADLVLEGIQINRFWITAAANPDAVLAALHPLWPETT